VNRARLAGVIDEFAKQYLHQELRDVRQSLLAKLDGLSAYDLRRPLTRTGTNLLGLIKHLSMTEARYLGDVFGRPFPDPLPRYDDPGYANHEHLWVTEHESLAAIVDGYRRACQHADATIEELPIDAAGYVAWWPRPNVLLFNVLVHVLTETNRHAGHADLLRESLDGAVGVTPATDRGEAYWQAHRARIEQAARRATDS
jgi:hypothetical protein